MTECQKCLALRHKILDYALQCNDYEQVLEQLNEITDVSVIRNSILKNVIVAFYASLADTGRTLLVICNIIDRLGNREEASSILVDHIFNYYPETEFVPADRMKWCKSQYERYNSYFPSSWDIKTIILQRFLVLFRAEIDRMHHDRETLINIARPLAHFETWAGQDYRTPVLLKHYRKHMAARKLKEALIPQDFFIWIREIVSDMRVILPLSSGIPHTTGYIHNYIAGYAECGKITSVSDLEFIIDMIEQLTSYLGGSEQFDKSVYIKRLEKLRDAMSDDINKEVNRIMSDITFRKKKDSYLVQLEGLLKGIDLKMSDCNKKLVLLSVCRYTITKFKSALLGHRFAINIENACTDYYFIQNIFSSPDFICREEISDYMIDIQKIIMLLQHSLAPQTSYIESFQEYSRDRSLFIKLLDLRGVKGRDRSCIIEAYDRNVGTTFLQTVLPFYFT